MSPNALQSCLGVDFTRLLPLVQQAHLGHIELRGHVDVARGNGLGGFLAGILGMPATNPVCPMTVQGDHLNDRMIWRRSFDGRCLESQFVLEGNHLIEMMGPLKLKLRPSAVAGRLHYELDATHVGPLRLPRGLGPTLRAWEGEADGLYEFEVDIGLPLIGRLVRYAGRLQLVKGG
ncbi:DUF4166 domain-containing protein [Dongia sp.]|uniref:DUF4166 domain-containing protein n=1 Tax=Dongia sp. TaxID=1977262 RepID=UPI0035B0822C